MGDDYTSPSARFEVNAHPAIWYVMGAESSELGDVMGMCLSHRTTSVGSCTLRSLPGLKARTNGPQRGKLPPWLRENTECRRLTAAVPKCNRPAIMYRILGIGMKVVGVHPKAFMKHGELQDLVLLGRSVQDREEREPPFGTVSTSRISQPIRIRPVINPTDKPVRSDHSILVNDEPRNS
jgi:hypothetical protein